MGLGDMTVKASDAGVEKAGDAAKDKAGGKGGDKIEKVSTSAES